MLRGMGELRSSLHTLTHGLASRLPLADDLAPVLEQIAPGVNQAIADNSQNGESWTDTLKRVLPSLTMGVQQFQLMQLNIERAKQGLPPIDIASYSGVGVNVGLSPDTQKLIMWGGAALLAVLLLRRA